MRKSILLMLLVFAGSFVRINAQDASGEIFDQQAVLNPVKELKEASSDDKKLSPEPVGALLKASFRLKDPSTIDFIKISLGSANDKNEFAESEIRISKEDDKYYYSTAAGKSEVKYNLINWSSSVQLSNYTTARFVTLELHHVKSSEVTRYYIPVH